MSSSFDLTAVVKFLGVRHCLSVVDADGEL